MIEITTGTIRTRDPILPNENYSQSGNFRTGTSFCAKLGKCR